jgi:glutamyl-tRNA reductase
MIDPSYTKYTLLKDVEFNSVKIFNVNLIRMQVVIIGSGNTATVLGKLIFANGFHISQVISRNITHAEILANELNCSFGDFSSSINETADI